MPNTHEILIDQEQTRDITYDTDPIEYLRERLEDGQDWPTALLEAIARWTTPFEVVKSRSYAYFIGGEAFDWLLLAERLCEAVGDQIPFEEKEALLFEGRFPDYFDTDRFRELLGVQKHRAYLNYFYGVTVEEALQQAAEKEVQKRYLSNGHQYKCEFANEVFLRVYRESQDFLMQEFRADIGYADLDSMSLAEAKEFSYWLFKYRMKTSDKAKIASDTKKGLDQLHQLKAVKDYSPLSL